MKTIVLFLGLLLIWTTAYSQDDSVHDVSLGDRENFIIYHPPISLTAPQYYSLANTSYFNGIFLGGYPDLIGAIEELSPPKPVLSEINAYNKSVWIARGVALGGIGVTVISGIIWGINYAVNLSSDFGTPSLSSYAGYYIVASVGLVASIISYIVERHLRPTNVIKEFNRWQEG